MCAGAEFIRPFRADPSWGPAMLPGAPALFLRLGREQQRITFASTGIRRVRCFGFRDIQLAQTATTHTPRRCAVIITRRA